MLPADCASELRSIARKTIRSDVSASGLFVFSQVADAIRRLVKLCVAAVRLREEKKAMDVVARTSQTGGVQASIFGTDKTMIVHMKPMRETAPLLILPPDMWRTVRKVDDRVAFGASWDDLEQMDRDREPVKRPYQLLPDLPAAVLVNVHIVRNVGIGLPIVQHYVFSSVHVIGDK
ncbi:hypothetical protein NDU88_002975 [Pleurodeles waltl]|uniref:Uncharacterized protein n=1 Tax=Pleurodeles waltl TaxID=8319 RepID=A0AAV7VEG3_PLEWA|nr:hypothetical protein NDU88_002975 [Pleurodeles waltl]